MSLFFYATLWLWRILFIYAIVGIILSIALNILNVKKSHILRKLLLQKRWCLILIVSLFLLSHTRQAFFQGYTEWDPIFSERDIVGVWEKGSNQIILSQNGEFVFKTNTETKNWSWFLSDESKIKIKTLEDDFIASFRIIQFDEQYRLLENNEEIFTLSDLGYIKTN